jgi:hypothetical protein
MNLKPMRSKYIFLFALSSLVLSGCASEKGSDSTQEERTYNSISGRVGVDGPIMAVKLDDTSSARPQIGLEDADVVYIEQVEGGLTRLAAIFSSEIPTNIGPIRSARISDIDILSQYGKVIFAYSGAQRAMLTVIANSNLTLEMRIGQHHMTWSYEAIYCWKKLRPMNEILRFLNQLAGVLAKLR